MNPKYIIIQLNDFDEQVKICSAVENHCDQIPFEMRDRVVAAGEFSLRVNEKGTIVASCFGHSTTLGKSSRGAEDEWRISQLLRIGQFCN